jgi:CO/xanthine dehydrogenase FAD-binding subunit
MVHADALLDVGGIPELKRIWLDDSQLHIGASASYTDIIGSELISRHAYLLVEASRQIGAPQIQHMGTVGGNLGNASPAGDTLPCLYTLNATVTLACAERERQVSMPEFMLGVRKTALQSDELITKISFDPLPQNAGSSFVKLGLRRSQAISVVDVAAVVFLDQGRITDARVALGSVAPTIVRSAAAEEILIGQTASEELFERAAEATRADISPITDIRGSAAYRHHVAKPLVKQALNNAVQRVTMSHRAQG